ncbi:MAG: HU family DNA-binding protein [Sulfurimicrobium sp.]|jgi:DNA-binding protein HU-beta|nr:HU family DNA-binding protein [Sulfurimicrobium sp.]
MNKTELIDSVAGKTGASKAKTAEMLDALMATVKESMAKNESVQLIGFGTFEVTERAAREGRNPATGAAMKIAAKKVVKFKVGKALADVVAGA